MAEDTWTLNDAQLSGLRAHLDKHLKGCWMCGENDWLVLPLLTGEKPFDPKADYLAMSDRAAKVRLTCRTCGNIAYMSAEVMGLVDQVEIPDE